MGRIAGVTAAETRERLLRAAAGVFAERGYDGTRVADIAAAALDALRRAQPNVSLAWIATQMPFQQDTEREHYVEAFRRAGLD